MFFAINVTAYIALNVGYDKWLYFDVAVVTLAAAFPHFVSHNCDPMTLVQLQLQEK